ncbi:MAG: Putative oxidoreductase [uncultured Friedmanniella sp.]|uniref:Oxidoreductase n=1 Tax=uncultured Friedmanniella sp. TaxID=335381 RepID=A0A6J4KS23_9ACTN|nr:MAG: Putative oxidoreductase [uncultured Friedmanniella sp.]
MLSSVVRASALYSDPVTSTPTVRWGIVGPGRIARNVVSDFQHVDGAEAVAVASRSLDRARAFADEHGLAAAYGSYGEIIAADDLDALYLATPHPQHHALALAAIEAGKAVLVEKTFTATVAGAEEVIAAARRRSVFAMEAMWTRFQPAIVAARTLVDDGAIGEVRQLQADLGVDRTFDPTDRLFDPAQGGGAMLDLGVYVVSFAQYFLGTPDRVVAHGSLAPTGVDAEAGLLLGYQDGRAATLLASLRHQTPGAARIQGTTGWIEVQPRFHHPRTIVLHRRGAEPEVITRPPVGGGYAHELAEVTEAVAAGRTESTVMPLDDTLAVQRILNEACEQLGVLHAEDAGMTL